MDEAPFPEPRGYMSAPGFVKSHPGNNDHYVAGFAGHPWRGPIARAHERLTRLDPGYNIAQIKEKFGELRFYFDLTDPRLRWPADLIVAEAAREIATREAVMRRRCRYVCGECGYDEVDRWSAHSAHYAQHRRARGE